MAKVTTKNWRQALRDEGCSTDEVRAYASAFEHGDSKRALTI
jgi:hypothetical protein